jgi:tetratricopeptide (TPR) repeat protein
MDMISSKIRAGLLACTALALGSSISAQTASSESANLSLIRDAAQSIAAGNLQRAETELQAVLRTNASEYRALNLLGIIRAQERRETEAEQLFKQAIEQKPDFASAHVDLGLLYVQMNRADDAVAQLQEALRLDPSRADAREALLGVWRTQARAASTQDLEKALALLLQARKLSPQNPDVLYDFGMVALRMSLFADAIQSFQESLAARKDDPNALYGLGRAQIGQGNFQDAEQAFEHYIQLRPNDASGHYALGMVLQSLQKNDQARRELQRSIEIQPVQTESYFQLGLMELDDDDSDGASALFARVLQRDPKHAGALTGMGRIAFQKKDYKQASDFLQRAIKENSSLRQAHYYLGMTFGRLNQKEDSDKELQIASRLEHAEVEKHQMGLRLLNPDAEPANGSEGIR